MKGILFKPDLIKANLQGIKCKTRRLLNPQPETEFRGMVLSADGKKQLYAAFAKKGSENNGLLVDTWKPKYQLNEVIYVKETYLILEPEHCEGMSDRFYYKLDHHESNEEWRQECIKDGYFYKWKSPLFMKSTHSRMFLKITDIKVERLQNITPHDAMWEGFPENGEPFYGRFKDKWISINGIESWGKNPWVWAYTYKRV
jgi:hypothetical protein